jgi:hypothetical protein
MTPIVSFEDLADDDEQRRAAERREHEAQAARLALVVSDAQADIANDFPNMSRLRGEALGDMLASHRWERAQAVAGGWSCRTVFQSAQALYAALSFAEAERDR